MQHEIAVNMAPRQNWQVHYDGEAQQGMLVSRYSVNNTTSDFNTVLNALKTNHPDLVFFGGQMHQAANLPTMRPIPSRQKSSLLHCTVCAIKD